MTTIERRQRQAAIMEMIRAGLRVYNFLGDVQLREWQNGDGEPAAPLVDEFMEKWQSAIDAGMLVQEATE